MKPLCAGDKSINQCVCQSSVDREFIKLKIKMKIKEKSKKDCFIEFAVPHINPTAGKVYFEFAENI